MFLISNPIAIDSCFEKLNFIIILSIKQFFHLFLGKSEIFQNYTKYEKSK